MNSKFGVGFITCNRESFIHRSMDSFSNSIFEHDSKASNVVVVNDGDPLDKTIAYGDLIDNPNNLGVGKSKNIAIKELMARGYDHIFIIEDDIIQKDKSVNVFEKYMDCSDQTGIQHFMFGYHGPANKGNVSKGIPQPRLVVKYNENCSVLLNLHCVGAFCHYTRECIEAIGMFDEEYNNAFEHVDHSYRAAKHGMIPGYWWWPDISNSYDYLDEIECSENSSSIRPRADWGENIQKGAVHFHRMHGYQPAWDNYVPDQSEYKIKNALKAIFSNYTVEK